MDIHNSNIDLVLDVLHRILPQKEYKFFSNFSRLTLIIDEIKKYSNKRDEILDLGCGPLILAFLLEREEYKNISCLDKNPIYMDIYKELKSKGLLTHTKFEIKDINDINLEKTKYNLVIIHDVLFIPEIDINSLLLRINTTLKPNGIICFDVWSQEFFNAYKPFYKIIYKKYINNKRYTKEEIKKLLNIYNFTIMNTYPVFGIYKISKNLRKMLYYLFKLSNTFFYIGQKTV